MSIKRELTGKTRFAAYSPMFGGKPHLVLQVEEREYGFYMSNSGGYVDTVDVDGTHYRNATVEDLSLIDITSVKRND